MKKTLAFLMAVMMLLSFCACGIKPNEDNSLLTGEDVTTTTAKGTTISSAVEDESTSGTGTTDGTTGAVNDTTDGDGDSTEEPADETSTSVRTSTKATAGSTITSTEAIGGKTSTTKTLTKATAVNTSTVKTPTKTPTKETTKKTTKAPTKTSVSDVSTSASTKTPTKMPTATKPTQPAGDEKAIRVLAVGDTYAVDAMEKYLYDLLKGAGYDAVHLGILYADNSTLNSHCNAVKNDTNTYKFFQNTAGKWEKQTKVAPSVAFKAAQWDYVVLQQAGADAGMDNTYGKLNELTAMVQQQCADAELYWHMNWAYRRQSDQEGFENYKYNSRKMYNAIVDAALKKVLPNPEVMGFVPSATTIQNLRTSVLRDRLTKDGVRLTDLGAYAVALTWYGVLTGESVKDVTYRPAEIKDGFAEILEAADNAISLPSYISPTTVGEGEAKDLRILSIGHSFSVDAMRTYMWDAFDAAGYDVTIAYLYYPSCSLEQHWHYISNNSKSYEVYAKNANGDWESQSQVDAKTALWDEDWDIVTFQPDPDFGYDKFLNNVPCKCEWGCGKNIESDYLHFNQLVDKVLSILADPANPNGPNTDVKLYYHLTWTYRQDCYLGSYLYPQGYNQLTLYQDFIEATKSKVLTNNKILGVIPCNTSIENARTSWMGDTFNAEGSNDGYHLNDKGDLAAALTWVSYFTGAEASKVLVDCPYSDAEFAAIAEAVNNAIAHPWEVTPSSYKSKP